MESFVSKAWLMLSLTLKHSSCPIRDPCVLPGYRFSLPTHSKGMAFFYFNFCVFIIHRKLRADESQWGSFSTLFLFIWSALQIPCMNNAQFQKAFNDIVLHPVYAERYQHYLQISVEHIRNLNVLNELKQKNPEELALFGSFLLQYLYSPFQLHRTQTFTLCSSILLDIQIPS